MPTLSVFVPSRSWQAVSFAPGDYLSNLTGAVLCYRAQDKQPAEEVIAGHMLRNGDCIAWLGSDNDKCFVRALSAGPVVVTENNEYYSLAMRVYQCCLLGF